MKLNVWVFKLIQIVWREKFFEYSSKLTAASLLMENVYMKRKPERRSFIRVRENESFLSQISIRDKLTPCKFSQDNFWRAFTLCKLHSIIISKYFRNSRLTSSWHNMLHFLFLFHFEYFHWKRLDETNCQLPKKI